MKYVVHAYENMYSGSHGIYNDFITYVNDEDEVINEARAASLDIMNSYSFIEEALMESVIENCDDEAELAELVMMRDEAMEENIAYEYCRVCDDSPDDINVDYEEFVENYRFQE